ncbi:hypothetical protein L7F22_017801 [Adiantum nelumboides]|nr:hypothetical protein [Adiantum nelumboides]
MARLMVQGQASWGLDAKLMARKAEKEMARKAFATRDLQPRCGAMAWGQRQRHVPRARLRWKGEAPSHQPVGEVDKGGGHHGGRCYKAIRVWIEGDEGGDAAGDDGAAKVGKRV